MNWNLRLARESDIAELEKLIPLSVRSLQSEHYSPAQMEAALGPVFGVDRQLIADGTYFAVEQQGHIIGCGGWRKRKTLYGGDAGRLANEDELDPEHDPARMRAFFVHPLWGRRGIGSSILVACEAAIRTAGFHRVELVATLAGEPLYASFNYTVMERFEIQLSNGMGLPVVRMRRRLVST